MYYWKKVHLVGDGVDGLLEGALEPLALQPDEEVHVQRNHLLDPDSTAAVICKHRKN